MAPPHCASRQASYSPKKLPDKKRNTVSIYRFNNVRHGLSYECYTETASYERYEHRLLATLSQHTREKWDIPSEESLRGKDLEDVYKAVLTSGYKLFQAEIGDAALNLGIGSSKSLEGLSLQNYTIHFPKAKILCLRGDSLGFAEPSFNSRSHLLAQVVARATDNVPKQLNSLLIDQGQTDLVASIEELCAKEYRHVLVIGCASHTYETLAEQIMSMPRFESVVKDCRAIARLFTSPRGCRDLHERILLDYGTWHVLPLYLFTEWGANYRLVRSVKLVKDSIYNLRSKAIASWRSRDNVQVLKRILDDETFWENLGLLDAILEPIDNAIRHVESGEAGLRDVLSEWQAIHIVMNRIRSENIGRLDLLDLPDFVRQVCGEQISASPATIVAHMLHPAHLSADVPLIDAKTAISSLMVVAKQTDQDPYDAVEQFYALRESQKTTTVNDPIWDDERIDSFWSGLSENHPALVQIASRVFAAPCSLTPAERSISATTTLLSAARNGLDLRGRVTQLSIFNNDRVIRGEGLWSTATNDRGVSKMQRRLEEDVVAAASLLDNASGGQKSCSMSQKGQP